MRKISEDAAEAFWGGTSFKRSNTRVTADSGIVCLIVCGHTIASRKANTTREFWIDMCGWPSRLTRERLNAILPHGHGLSQSDGEQLLDGVAIPDDAPVYFWDWDKWGLEYGKQIPLAQMLNS